MARARDEPHMSIHERRRRAPMHFWAKADNARFVASMLASSEIDAVAANQANVLPYHGSPGVALRETFLREASIALELIIKAVIARKIELGLAPPNVVRVRATHDVRALWREANLPHLPPEDAWRLAYVKSLLYWSSRYAAPKTDEGFCREQQELDALAPQRRGTFQLAAHPLGWTDFERLYQVAALELVDLIGHELRAS